MKKIFTLFLFCVVLVGCRGRTGKDGTGGGEMQSFTGVTDVDGFGVQVNNFGDLDEVTAYYALASAPHDFFELKGPDTAMTTAPYYALLYSGSNVLVRMYNVPVGSPYRILIWRPAGLI